MAINHINNLASSRLQNTASSQGTSSQSVRSSPQHKAATTQQDSVSLTSEAQQLQKMQQNLNTASTGNESKVEQLKRAVASGEYQVNSEAVAKKMLNLEGTLDKILG